MTSAYLSSTSEHFLSTSTHLSSTSQHSFSASAHSTVASTHFSAPDADLVLRSGAPNSTDFRVHRCILAASSPFFSDMFSLPQPTNTAHDVPLVEVSENADVLDKLLSCIYPVPNPDLATLDELAQVLEAACKYDVTASINHLRALLVSPRFIEKQPLRVYAIACRFDLEEEAAIAAQHTLNVNLLECPLTDDLKHLSAYSFQELLNMHKRRAAAAQELLVLHEDVKCTMCNGTHYGQFIPPRWWKDFEARARKELEVRPTTAKIFSMGFLAESARAGCERCAGSILQAGWFFDQLKQSIDSLPATV
ncbi:hypothetical protein BDW22DRAFT_836363 [Trametopsis cervina]|nr:hypothetical protein BDW22DRAFT_836363 [Trametopsis cervina]